MAHLMTADEKLQAGALLGVISRELRERGYPHAAQQDRVIDAFLDHIEALEAAQVKLATDLVNALSDLSGQFRGMARLLDGDVLNPGEYDQGRGAAYRDAAGVVDALSTGPVMQQALDTLDARTPE